jgi:hypothetical protein
MLHPADKHSSNGILRSISCSRARDSNLRIFAHSYYILSFNKTHQTVDPVHSVLPTFKIKKDYTIGLAD